MFKKFLCIIMVTLISISMLGCSETIEFVKPDFTKPVKIEILETDCEIIHGRSEDGYKLDAFIESVQNNSEASLRVIQYTIEGDPIIRQLSYINGEIKLETDWRYDQYGNGGITTKYFNGIRKEITEYEERNTADYVFIRDNEEYILIQIIIED